MKKKRMLSLLLSAALALSSVPVIVSAAITETVEADELAPATSNTAVTYFDAAGAESYVWVGNIADKNKGAYINIPTDSVTLEAGKVYKAQFKIRPSMQSKSIVKAVNNVTEVSGEIGTDLRGFRIYVNGVPAVGELVANAYNNLWHTDGALYKQFEGGSFNVNYQMQSYYDADPETTDDALVLNPDDTTDTTVPFLAATMSAPDSKGWRTYTVTFKVSDTNNSLSILNPIVGIKPGALSLNIQGSNSYANGNPHRDVAPFDIDDVAVYVADENTVIPTEEADNVIVASDTSIFSEDFANGNNIVTKSGSDTVWVNDDESYYRVASNMTNFYLEEDRLLTKPGVYTFSADFRVSGYNPWMITAASHVAASHEMNWREIGVRLEVSGGNRWMDRSVGEASTQYVNAITSKVPATTDPNEWTHLEFTYALKAGDYINLDSILIRGGMQGQTATKLGVDTLNNTLEFDHRLLTYDVKNMKLELTEPYCVEEESGGTTPNSSAITGNVLDDAVVYVNGAEATSATLVETAGIKNNKYLHMYDRVNGSSAGFGYNVSKPILKGTDIYLSFDIRAYTTGDGNNVSFQRILTTSENATPRFNSTYYPDVTAITYADVYNYNGAAKGDSSSVYKISGSSTDDFALKAGVAAFTPTNVPHASALGITKINSLTTGLIKPEYLNANNKSLECYYYFGINSTWTHAELMLTTLEDTNGIRLYMQRGPSAYCHPVDLDNFKVFYFPDNDTSKDPIYLACETFDDCDDVSDVVGANWPANMFTTNNGGSYSATHVKAKIQNDEYTYDVASGSTNTAVTYKWDSLPAGVYTLGGNVRLDYYYDGALPAETASNYASVKASLDKNTANISASCKIGDAEAVSIMDATAINSEWSSLADGITFTVEEAGTVELTLALDANTSFEYNNLALVKTGNIAAGYTWTLTAPDGAVTGITGVTEGNVTEGTAVSFTVDTESYDVVITVGGETKTYTAADNVFTIPGADITGAVTVTVTEKAKEEGTVSFIEKMTGGHGALAADTKVLVVSSNTNDKAATYDGNAMFYSARYGGYVAIIAADVDADTAKGKLDLTVSGSCEVIKHNGDVTGDDRVTAGDALYVSQMIHGVDAPDRARLEADAYNSGDGNAVTTADCKWILRRALGLE